MSAYAKIISDYPDTNLDANRRQHERLPTKDLCEIVTENPTTAIGCIVHNISEGGALIEVSTTNVPKRFMLVNHTKGTKVVCTVAWQCGHQLGAQFKSKPRSVGETVSKTPQ